MDRVVAVVTEVNGVLNSFAWGPIMLFLLVGTGIYLTIRTRCIQVTRFGFAMRNTVGSMFRNKSKDHGKNLSPFQAMTTALASTVGTGNIAGVTGRRCILYVGFGVLWDVHQIRGDSAGGQVPSG